MSIAWFGSTPEMDDLFSEAAEVQAWLDVEAALARAQASLGVIPDAAAREISARADVDNIDLKLLRSEIASAVHPVVPVVRMLAACCADDHGEFVHFGATTQDVLDTGLVLRLQRAERIIASELNCAVGLLRSLAVEHRDTPMVGRTHGQHAVPITFGYKVAVWLDELARHRSSLEAIRPQVMVGQFGGATGTLASLGPVGLQVRRELMADLGLGEPEITWHTARDRLAHVAFVFSLIAATLQRIAAEVVLLQRNEIAEVAEPFHKGKIGSSTMPHKRNPAFSESLWTLGELVKNDLRSALSGLGSVNERDKAVFTLEIDYLPRTCRHVHRMLILAVKVLAGLTVDTERMAANLEASDGQVFSERVMMFLGGRIGRLRAHEVLYEISMRAFSEGVHLKRALSEDERVMSVLNADELDLLFDLGDLNAAAVAQVDRVCSRTNVPEERLRG